MNKLTKYKESSLAELWAISWPLMLGFLSTSLMMFADRFFLAKFSYEMMNAQTTASSALISFLILPITISSITEVFVGLYRGENKAINMGIATWQMIWFSIFIAPIFIIVGFFSKEILFPHSAFSLYQKQYFFLLLSCGTIFCTVYALQGFFASRGEVKIVAIATTIANILNILLDIFLIFGNRFIKSLGIKGAAISTIISQIFLVMFLFHHFFAKENIINGCLNWKFNPKIFKDCLKIGFPSGLAQMSEFLSRFIFFQIMSFTGNVNLTITSLLNSIYLLLVFITEGTYKGVIAISSNLIGAKKYFLISKHFISSVKLNLIFFSIILCIFYIFSPNIFSYFFNDFDKKLFYEPIFLNSLSKTSFWFAFYFLFEGLVWMISGILNSFRGNCEIANFHFRS